MKYIQWFILIFIFFFVYACGSDSKGPSLGVPANAIAIDGASAQQVAEDSMEFASADAASPVNFLAKANFKMSDMPVGTSVSFSGACDDNDPANSGTISMSGSIADTTLGDVDQTPTSGSFSITFNQCKFLGDTETLHGTVSLSWTSNGTTMNVTVSMNISNTDNVTSVKESVIGNMTASVNTADPFDFTISYNMVFDSSDGGGFYVQTTTPITGDATGISAGVLLVGGANNSKVEVTFLGGGQYSYRYDVGDGVWVDGGTHTVPVIAKGQ